MKENKGFTLVELLGVIAILAVILSITTVVVYNVLERNNEDAWIITKTNLENSAEIYIKENMMNCLEKDPDINQTYCKITLKELSEFGYIGEKVSNPVIKEDIDMNQIIRVYTTENGVMTSIYDEEQTYEPDFLDEREIR